jgi:hypothetical protein
MYEKNIVVFIIVNFTTQSVSKLLVSDLSWIKKMVYTENEVIYSIEQPEKQLKFWRLQKIHDKIAS